MFNNKLTVLFLIAASVIPITCKKADKEMMVTTGKASNITYNSARISGNILDVGKGAIQYGHYYSITTDVSASGSKTSLGVPSGKGEFTSDLTNLQPETKYYFAAYMTNGTETVFGEVGSFLTDSLLPPSVITNSATLVGKNTATMNAVVNGRNMSTAVTFEYGLTTDYGSVINASPGSVTGNSATNVSALLTDLSEATLYHYRVKAISAGGTAYGKDISFTTYNTPAVNTGTVEITSSTTASVDGTVMSDGGSTVTARGICWSTNQDPTVELVTKTVDGSGTGIYTGHLTGLTVGETYHVRAYATNSIGTGYGEDIQFTFYTIPTIVTDTISNLTYSSITTGGSITNDGGTPVTARGVCWSTSQNPTTSNSNTVDGDGMGDFTSLLTGLATNTIYYVRSYATNNIGTEYGNELSFILWMNVPGPDISDIDGNIYQSVKIGNQIWMKENLKVTKYNDSTPLLFLTGSNWGSEADAYCNYGDIESNADIYGRLYTWSVTALSNPKNVCPVGWHIPDRNDWNDLALYLGDYNNAGGLIKETGTQHWADPNTGATNERGFTGLPGGYRNSIGYTNLGNIGLWWSSTNYSASGGITAGVTFDSNSMISDGHSKFWGVSARCLKE